VTDINNYLTKLAKSLIISPDQKSGIETSITNLRTKLWAHFQDRLLRVDVFGSYERQTLVPVDADLDVDVLVVFKQNEFKPDTFLNHLKDFAEKNYPKSEVYPDHPTISTDMNHVRFELVPAYPQSEDRVKIPAPRTKEVKWIVTSPTAFTSRINRKEQKQ
jgi:tRNA nucleotidyltransferase (CCA-adding enzyme)